MHCENVTGIIMYRKGNEGLIPHVLFHNSELLSTVAQLYNFLEARQWDLKVHHALLKFNKNKQINYYKYVRLTQKIKITNHIVM